MLGGLDRPTGGSVIVDGRDLSTLKDEELTIFRRRKIGFVFQNYNLVPVLNVYENIVLPIQLDGRGPDKGYTDQIIETLGLGPKLQNLPNNLSGGQQQRVAIARALAAKPAIILADEPTGNLDSRTSQDVMSLLKVTSQRFAQTIVMITHNEAIAQMADRVIRIEDGRIVVRGRGAVVLPPAGEGERPLYCAGMRGSLVQRNGHGKLRAHPGLDYLVIGVNWGYTGDRISNGIDPVPFITIVVILLLIIFTGYLIIYNIFQISVTNDIRFYGLLKTIGATGRQIKRMIRQQALLLSLVGIPIGLLLGFVAGNILAPVIMAYLNYKNGHGAVVFPPAGEGECPLYCAGMRGSLVQRNGYGKLC